MVHLLFCELAVDYLYGLLGVVLAEFDVVWRSFV